MWHEVGSLVTGHFPRRFHQGEPGAIKQVNPITPTTEHWFLCMRTMGGEHLSIWSPNHIGRGKVAEAAGWLHMHVVSCSLIGCYGLFYKPLYYYYHHCYYYHHDIVNHLLRLFWPYSLHVQFNVASLIMDKMFEVMIQYYSVSPLCFCSDTTSSRCRHNAGSYCRTF